MKKGETKLLKALETVSAGFAAGTVPVDILIKANETYCAAIGFDADSMDYQIKVAKSCMDAINGVEPDAELSKAIVPGTTKVIDGVMYVYSATTPGSKQAYDWHVVQKGSKSGKTVGRGSKLTGKQVDDKQKFINQLFPKDLSSLKVVKQLGGSTGAVLVEDVDGNQYVKKTGSNTSNEHVAAEYLSNQLYDILGVRTPDYEVYEDNGETVLLSRYIPNTRVPSAKDYKAMGEDLIADVVLANWDVYQNDNCLIDGSGRVIRVDNGSCLEWRAQGKKKNNPPFNNDVMKTYKDMMRFNPAVFSQQSDDEILAQIAKIRAKRDDIVAFLEESGQPQLAQVMGQRIDNLSQIEAFINKQKNLKNPVIVPRNLKDSTEMYREFTDAELDKMWKAAQGSGTRKLFQTNNSEGWALLSTICKERGFDARPRVLDDAAYWAFVKKAKNPQMFRGVTDGGGMSADECVASFKYDDACFYGQYGVWGEGIYAHMNDGTNNKDNTDTGHFSSDAYKAAMGYAGSNAGGILYLAYEDDVVLAKVEDLKAEILNNPPQQINTAQQKALASQIAALDKQISDATDELNNISDKTVQDVYKAMHYDGKAIGEMEMEIDSTDWGALTDEGEPDIPEWSDFIETRVAGWIKANGGTAVKGDGIMTFTLPNSRKSFTISEYQYSGPGAIKQKNQFTRPYHFALERLHQWVMTEHVAKVERAKQAAIDDLGDKINNLKTDIQNHKTNRAALNQQLNQLSNPDPDADIYSAIYSEVKSGSLEAIGVYAALKGYDGIYQPHGNGGPNSFAIILNRSKIVVKK